VTSGLVWTLTIVGVLAFLLFDFIVVVRKPHEPTFKESVRWTGFYIAVACLFGLSMMWWRPEELDGAPEFFAGYVTEWSLSVDNLFVFLVILARFAVPVIYRQRVLLIGIGIALVLRGGFILVGAAALHAFTWVFYLFGAFLLWTAISVAREGGAEEGEVEYHENRLMRWIRRVFPASPDYRGTKLFVRENGKRLITPMLLVMIAIGTTDVLFALDSIPAIFGLTQDPYIVFVANAFALMGLRQLFFVVEGLLRRLVYLSYGLAFILAFIGVKLFLEALRTNTLPFINGGHEVPVPEISTWVSLAVILSALIVAAAASLIKTRGLTPIGGAADADAVIEPGRDEAGEPR
jgi:tellurite resistance protein TerC